MLSATTEYALRSMVLLAMRQGSAQTAQQIATETKVPIDYLFKVLQALSRAGLVQAQRGKNGGFRLASDPADISIYDVVQAVDPIKLIATCPLGIEAHGIRLCSLHRKMDDALRHIEEAFSSTKLADLIDDSSPIRPLCAGEVMPAVEIKPLPSARTSHAKPF